MEGLEAAKRAGFTLEEARALLQRSQAGSPGFEALRELAERKLPEVERLIARGQAMRSWLLTASDCSCTSFDACELFEAPSAASR